MEQNHLDCSSLSSMNLKSTNIYGGDLTKDHFRQGYGTQEWKKSYLQKYNGEFTNDNLHNYGIYCKLKPKRSLIHEGYFYANNIEGYGNVVMENGTYFEGLFKHNRRFGPGVQTRKNGSQDVGLWDGLCLVRLCQVVLPECIPRLGITSVGKAHLLNFRKLIQFPSGELDVATRILQNLSHKSDFSSESYVLYNDAIRNPKSLFFNKPSFDERYNKQNYLCIDVALSNTELSFDGEQEEEIEFNEEEEVSVKMFIDDLKSQSCASMEADLTDLKMSILNAIQNRMKNSQIPTKKVNVTGVLAWNNEPIFIEMLIHCFKNRNHEDILNFDICKLLSSERDYFGDIGEYETACVAFLSACSNGYQLDMAEIAFNYNIDPDVCDARGNSGMFFASARDRLSIIGYLVELGANLDMQNDEGLTPLSMCLLRYIAILKDVTNWEEAFLSTSIMDEDIKTWCPRTSVINLVTHSVLEHVAFCNSVFFKDNNKMFLHDSSHCENMDLAWLLNGLHLPLSQNTEFQERYNQVDASKVGSYVFGAGIIYVAKPTVRKEKKQKPKKEIPILEAHDTMDSKHDKLEVVLTTILLLLYYRVDPNVGEVPIPIPFLGIFTGSYKIVESLLTRGANFCITLGPDCLTALHVLVSLPLHADIPSICNLLLEFTDLDPNLRTGPEHWSEERDNIIGDVRSSVDDEGKTPLHILAMRMDFNTDPGHIMTNLVEMLVNYRGSPSMKYLGHTALSLATLRGNIELVRCLLNIGCQPNEILEQHLGNCLTIYILKRYTKTLPDVNTCKEIMDLLVKYYGNPLNPVEEFNNAIEFMVDEDVIVKAKTKEKDKSKRVKKRSTRDEMKDYLLLLGKNILFRHYQCKALLLLLQAVIDNEIDELFAKSIAKFLTIEDSVKIIKLLIRKKIIQMQFAQYICIYRLLEFIDENCKNTKVKQQPVDIETVMEDLKWIQTDKESPFKICKEFELDPIEDKYIVCFECLMRSGKVLLPCPKCGMVYFCSQICNKINLKNSSKHPCALLFYDEEKMKWEKSGDIYIPEVTQNHLKFVDMQQFATFLESQLETLDDNKIFYKNNVLSFLEKHGQMFSLASLLKAKTVSTRKQTKSDLHQQSLKSKTIFSNISQGYYQTDAPRINNSLRGSKPSNDTNGNVAISKVVDKGTCTDIEVTEIFNEIKPDLINMNDQKHQKRFKKQQNIIGQKSDIEYDIVQTMYKEKKRDNKKVPIKPLYNKEDDLKFLSKEEIKSKADLLMNIAAAKNIKLQERVSIKESKEDIREGTLCQLVKTPTTYQKFLAKMAQYFPELDLDGLSMPFVCYKDGQWYYKFDFNGKPVNFFSTYTSV